MLPEVGAFQILVIAAIALIVVGPKDLPIVMRKVGRFLGQMRAMASEFRASFDEMARQSELDELRKEVEAMRQAAQQPASLVASHVGLDEVRNEIDSSLADRLHADPDPYPLPPDPYASPPDEAPPMIDPHATPNLDPLAAEEAAPETPR